MLSICGRIHDATCSLQHCSLHPLWQASSSSSDAVLYSLLVNVIQTCALSLSAKMQRICLYMCHCTENQPIRCAAGPVVQLKRLQPTYDAANEQIILVQQH